MQQASGAKQMCPQALLRRTGHDLPKGNRDLNVIDSHGSWLLSQDTGSCLFLTKPSSPTVSPALKRILQLLH